MPFNWSLRLQSRENLEKTCPVEDTDRWIHLPLDLMLALGWTSGDRRHCIGLQHSTSIHTATTTPKIEN